MLRQSLLVATCLMSLIVHAAVAVADEAKPAAEQDGIRVYFSPDGGAAKAIEAEIDKAEKSVQVLTYTFTSRPLAEALLRAQKRGVRVQIVMDRLQAAGQYSSATFFHNQGMACFIDAKHTAAHSKVMLIDGKTIITGSFNFTRAADETNAENSLIIEGKQELADAYAANFAKHLEHAVRYTGPAAKAPAQPRAPPAANPPKSTPAGQQAQADDGDGKLFRTETGSKYHRDGCTFLRRSKIGTSLAGAKALGLEPCSRCKPGT